MGSFADWWNTLSFEVYKINEKNGWIKNNRNDGELIALMHSELSEALEYLRNGNGVSNHIPPFSGVEEELSDVIIRIMDFAYQKQLKIPDAILNKIRFNSTREYRHGGKRF